MPFGEGKTEACDAKMRPFPNDTELRCGEVALHAEHRAVLRDYAYPGSETVITWQADDRRNFFGEWARCEDWQGDRPGCTLPAGHHGRCAP